MVSYSTINEQVIPTSISDSLNLSGYLFDKSVVHEWGDYILFACRTTNSTYNNRVILFNKLWKKFDVPQYYNISCLANISGSLVASSSIDNNAWQLFSGYDDDDAEINNELELNYDDLGTERLKKLKMFRITGEIQRDQELYIYAVIDNGSYIELGTLTGSDDEVDTANSVTIGSDTIGSSEIGGGTTLTAYTYDKTFNISDKINKFKDIKIKFVSTGLGYISVTEIYYWDIRLKELKPPQKYR